MIRAQSPGIPAELFTITTSSGEDGYRIDERNELPDANFGVFSSVSLGGLVYFDSDRDGVYDHGSDQRAGGIIIQLDLHGDGTAGDNYSVIGGRGTRFSYVDRDGDTVVISLRTGVMTIIRNAATGEGETLGLSGTTSASILSGSVRAPRRGATPLNGKTTFQSITGLGAGRNSLPTAQFIIPPGRISAMVVDALLEDRGFNSSLLEQSIRRLV